MNFEWLHFTRKDLAIEREQLLDEGKDRAELEPVFQELSEGGADDEGGFQARFEEFLDNAQSAPTRDDFPFIEPSDLGSIRELRPEGPRRMVSQLSNEEIQDRIHAAWLGRCAGNLLGKPIEGWLSKRVWGFLRDQGRFPLADYFRSDVPEGLIEKYRIDPKAAFINTVSHAVEDDDLNYTVTGLAILKQYGRDFSPENVGEFWLANIPILHVCTAERVAYRNLVRLIPPPRSATTRNPYREWIGAQIRGDLWGYAALGNPELAAEFAWRDASISHVKNGVYGEMWVAAMVAAAPFAGTLREVIEIGLSEIPANCRLAAAIREVLEWRSRGIDYSDAIGKVHQLWNESNPHHWCHTISNAQIVAVGLLWGGSDFSSSICRAVQPCYDTDCNGATVGSIFGMMSGTKGIPERWTDPLHDTLETGVAGYRRVRISDLAKETHEVHRTLG